MSGPALLSRIQRFLRESAMPESAFGRGALHDPNLIRNLRQGREPEPATIARVDAFMARWRADHAAGRVQPIGDRRTRAWRGMELA